LDELQIRSSLVDTEIQQVFELAQICLQSDQSSLNPILDVSLLRSPKGEIAKAFLFYVDKRLAGFLGITVASNGGEVRLTGMVHPNERRKKIATKLLTAAKTELDKHTKKRRLIVCNRSSSTGNEFIKSIGAPFEFSEYHLTLIPTGLPSLHKNTIDLRRVESHDIPVVQSILMKCFGDTKEEALPFIERAMKAKEFSIYIAKLGIWSIGTITITNEGSEMYLSKFAVQPIFQGKGYGKQILLQCIEQIRKEDDKPIKLRVQVEHESKLELYKSCGFYETDHYDYFRF
jgi:GNAT superfamily N-acetyltransferase